MSAHKKVNNIRYFAIDDKGNGKIFRHRRNIKPPFTYVRKVFRLTLKPISKKKLDTFGKIIVPKPKFDLPLSNELISINVMNCIESNKNMRRYPIDTVRNIVAETVNHDPLEYRHYKYSHQLEKSGDEETGAPRYSGKSVINKIGN